jgi:hypothetical protein
MPSNKEMTTGGMIASANPVIPSIIAVVVSNIFMLPRLARALTYMRNFLSNSKAWNSIFTF